MFKRFHCFFVLSSCLYFNLALADQVPGRPMKGGNTHEAMETRRASPPPGIEVGTSLSPSDEETGDEISIFPMPSDEQLGDIFFLSDEEMEQYKQDVSSGKVPSHLSVFEKFVGKKDASRAAATQKIMFERLMSLTKDPATHLRRLIKIKRQKEKLTGERGRRYRNTRRAVRDLIERRPPRHYPPPSYLCEDMGLKRPHPSCV